MTDLFARRPVTAPWLRFYAPGVPPDLSVPPVTLPDLLDDAARRFRFRAALSCQGRRTGFRALRRAAVRCAAALDRLGVGRGDRVAVLLPDCPELVVLCHAVWRLGAVVVPGNPADPGRAVAGAVVAVVPRERGPETARAGRYAALSVVVTVEVGRRGGPGARRRGGIPAGSVSRASLTAGGAPPRPRGPSRTTSARGPGTAPRQPRQAPTLVAYHDLDRRDAADDRSRAGGPLPEDIAVVLPRRDGTSVTLRHRHLAAAAHQIRAWHPESAQRSARLLSLVPLSGPHGLALGVAAAALTGACTVLVPDGDPATALRAARRAAPTVLAASPARLRLLMERPAHEREALATVRTVVTGPLDAVTGERLRAALDVRVVEAYGPTAAAGIALANPATADARSGTAGIPLPGTEVRIAVEGALAAEALPGHAGELLLRGPQFGDVPGLMPGGWLRTGRLAMCGPDGFVTLLDARGGDDGPGGAARRP
ncbi:AMP-binding protein [Streptomyces sp. YJ-C3]